MCTVLLSKAVGQAIKACQSGRKRFCHLICFLYANSDYNKNGV